MYMAVMDRMAGRLASLAHLSTTDSSLHSSLNNGKKNPDGGGFNNADDDADGTTLDNPAMGSIITPAQLRKWRVTIKKGEALPSNLSPAVAMGRTKTKNGATTTTTPRLTLEWVPKHHTNKEEDGWNVVLRLQDKGNNGNASPEEGSSHDGGTNDPITARLNYLYRVIYPVLLFL